MPEAGNFVVVSTKGDLSELIKLGEVFVGGYTQWTHAAICTSVDDDGNAWIVEAEPGGAVHVPFHYYGYNYLWSIDFPLTPAQQQKLATAALGYVGTPYSFADYAAIALHRFRVPIPQLKAYIGDSGHLICSQLVDKCYQDAGIQLFNDGRWNGYVTPGDLGKLIQKG
jgi:cell wall-associated NlpC family hydrolase